MKSTQKAASLDQDKSKASKPEPVLKADASKLAKPSKVDNKSKKVSKKKHVSAPIQEIEDDTADMETE